MEITITQEVKELLYDIENKTHLTAQAREMKGTKNYQVASYIQASDEDSTINQIRRSLTDAFSTLKTTLSEYLNEEKTTADNKIYTEIDNNSKLTISLNMPNNYDCSLLDSLSNNIHAYLVSKTIADWFTITNREDADIYNKDVQIRVININMALSKRKRPERPTYN